MRKWITGEWRSLLMFNYEIAPGVLYPHVPADTEIDDWNGKSIVSLVGLLFLRAKVLGLSIPFHRNFEQINFRFYIRKKTPAGWKRGVAFIQQIVPRFAIALTARVLYQENCVALPTRHEFNSGSLQYSWKFHGKWNSMNAKVIGEPQPMVKGSQEQFVADRFWGCSPTSKEYTAEHPSWRISSVRDASLECDVANLYGSQFVAALQGPCSFAFLAEGSPVAICSGRSEALLL